MNLMFIVGAVAVLGGAGVLCEGRVRRQIWPAPGRPEFFWGQGGGGRDPEALDGGFWEGPRRFEQPPRGQGVFREEFGGGRGSRRTTTESLGPITSPPRTVHTAPQGCACPMTQQFNPVCGTDGNTYRNRGLLNCYRRCGTNVSQKRLGTC